MVIRDFMIIRFHRLEALMFRRLSDMVNTLAYFLRIVDKIIFPVAYTLTSAKLPDNPVVPWFTEMNFSLQKTNNQFIIIILNIIIHVQCT